MRKESVEGRAHLAGGGLRCGEFGGAGGGGKGMLSLELVQIIARTGHEADSRRRG